MWYNCWHFVFVVWEIYQRQSVKLIVPFFLKDGNKFLCDRFVNQLSCVISHQILPPAAQFWTLHFFIQTFGWNHKSCSTSCPLASCPFPWSFTFFLPINASSHSSVISFPRHSDPKHSLFHLHILHFSLPSHALFLTNPFALDPPTPTQLPSLVQCIHFNEPTTKSSINPMVHQSP